MQHSNHQPPHIAPAPRLIQREPLPSATGETLAMLKSSGRKRTKKDRACDLCRRKKIRCDYDQTYPQQPCTSCRGYGKTCTFNEAAKKRGPPKGYVEGLENRLRRMEELLFNMANGSQIASSSALEDAERSRSESHDDDSQYGSDDDSDDNDNHDSGAPVLPKKAKRAGSHDNVTRPDEVTQPTDEDGGYSYMGSSSGVYLLGRLLPQAPSDTPARPQLVEGDENDVMIARSSHGDRIKMECGKNNDGRWELPPKDVVKRLLDIYFERVNVFLPIVDEEDFRESYATGTDLRMPLLMAMCRASCRLLQEDDPVVIKHHIRRAELFQTIVNQMDRQFSLDILDPKIETIQVLLLCAVNATKWGPESTDWIGTSIAVKMAQDLGLHRSDAQWNMPKRNLEARKRLWWSAYVADRWVCAALGRPLAVSDADCDLEYPDEQDQGRPRPCFVAMVKLSGILGEVLRTVCSPRARTLYDKGTGLEQVVRNLEQQLQEWKRALPADVTLDEDDLQSLRSLQCISSQLELKLNAGAGLLFIAYNSVLLLSKRSLVSMGPSGVSSSVTFPTECLTAVQDILAIFQATAFRSFLSFGWSLASYCLSQTITLIFLNFQNADPQVAAAAKNQAELFKDRYRGFEAYITEPSIIPFLERLARIISSEVASSTTDASCATTSDASTDPQQMLWGTMSGIDWQDMVTLLSEASSPFPI